jgi:MFS transporter, DHA2 family, methylenomycin A resistance protein
MALQFEEIVSNGVLRRPRATDRTVVLLALCLGVLVAQIDTSVVNLATPAIGGLIQLGGAIVAFVRIK